MHGQPADALKILAKIYGAFTDGFENIDLRLYRRLLAANLPGVGQGHPAHSRRPNSDIENLESSHGCVSLSHRMFTRN
jgi:hypothetical protein